MVEGCLSGDAGVRMFWTTGNMQRPTDPVEREETRELWGNKPVVNSSRPNFPLLKVNFENFSSC